jgi:8-oxo-dGTP pyrophosphatase MutT (NUDIX family)
LLPEGNATLKQVAAIPVRRHDDGKLEVLLVTSRETRRWVVPKGWPWADVPDHEAAAAEAWEEAGVRGRILSERLGTFTYDKRREGVFLTVDVVVYLLEVTEEKHIWPEMEERQRAWFSPVAAAQAVAEPELKALLYGLETSTE